MPGIKVLPLTGISGVVSRHVHEPDVHALFLNFVAAVEHFGAEIEAEEHAVLERLKLKIFGK